MNNSLSKALKAVFVGTLMFVTCANAMAQGEAQSTPTGVVVHGSVYGGGNLADVKENAEVKMSTGSVAGNVFGGGKGKADNFDCDKAMVGIAKDDDGEPIDDGVKLVSGTGENAVYTLKPGGTTVTITDGTVEGDVYGGGEVGRVERNTIVTIGEAGNTSLTPVVKGHVFGAGKGVETHGYSALVRGDATVTIQGQAQVWQNVHGGGEKASVGRYQVAITQALADQYHVRMGMPCYLKAGGKCTVNIQDNATIGKQGESNTGDVFGAGQGVTPSYNNEEDDVNRSKRMVKYNAETHTIQKRDIEWNYYVDEEGEEDQRYVWEYFTTEDAYLLYMETLGRASETDVVIGGKRETEGVSAGTITASTDGPIVKGTVYGGSESGFVYYSTAVNMLKGTVNGDVFGGGKGLASYAEAGRVRINTNLTISDGTVDGSVYGGGSLGDVGRIKKNASYNYMWTDQTDPAPDPDSYSWNNTGVCNVTINGGTIGTGVTQNSDGTFTKGNVYGAGKGSGETWWCEKAIAYQANVTITAGTVNGTVYGGGQVGRVETDAIVTIGVAPAGGGSGSGEGEDSSSGGGATNAPTIAGNVFGAGAGLATHGYSALVRGNAAVTVQGTAQVGGSVYGGGEIASVGKFEVVGGLPTKPKTGGTCIVNIKDNAKIGESGTGHNVYGACKGVTPAYVASGDNRSKSMQLLANAPSDGSLWSHYDGDENSPFIWRYYETEADYLAFLKTLALTSHPHVTIGGTWTPNETTGTITASGTPKVYGSVYGGGQRGVTLGNVDVNMVAGTVEQDVYGGGALADTNLGNWDVNGYVEVTGLTAGASVTGLYTRTETDGKYTYTKITDESATADGGTTYYRQEATWAHTEGSAFYTTSVDLTGGTIEGDAYGGGLGQKTGFYDAQNTIAAKDIEAVVWGDINVTLGSNGGLSATSFYTTYDNAGTSETPVQVIKSGRVFGCNNLLGSPQGDVTVTVWRTVAGNGGTQVRTTAEVKADNKRIMDAHPDDYETVTGYVTPTYEVAAVYGGGNLAPYEAAGKKAHVIINGCNDTSIQTVYGGGNAAAVPETMVDIYSCYEIGNLFGGGNGKDMYKKGNSWVTNPGANVNGSANTLIYGGTVHEAYGGSNEKGTITGDVTIDIADGGTGSCTLDVAKLVGAGKNADVNGDLKIIMGCKPSEKVPLVFGGADNANVNGDVELTITSGNWGKVVGGNNSGGCIKGHIILNIQETTCIPLNIEHLYLCGNNAAYSQYGYYVKTTETEAGTGYGDSGEHAILTSVGKLELIPRESANDPHKPVDTYSYTYNESTGEAGATWTVLPTTGNDKFTGYAAPVLNVTSCTSIGEVFGGGYGVTATVYGNPTVNINMTPGDHADEIDRDDDGNPDDTDGNLLGAIGDVYGGGDAAAVYGNTTVNIGTTTSTSVYRFAQDQESGEYKVQYDHGVPIQDTKTVTGAYITGDVYGGGKLADVGKTKLEKVDGKDTDVVYIEGSTFVNIGAVKGSEILDEDDEPTGRFNYTSVSFAAGDPGITIGGNVYGGGQGEALQSGNGAFRCSKAMVTKNTNVAIGNGTIGDGDADHGHVYGGGEKGRVQENTTVTIGCENDANSKPVITGNVFGAGKGVNTHGYSALTRGNSYVTVQGEAKVKMSVYGGGEIASVGKYNINAQGLPESLANQGSGYCTVTVRDNAVIGPDEAMIMTRTGYPDDKGHVFGAGKGALPYEGYGDSEVAWRVDQYNNKQDYLSKNQAIAGTDESSYLTYVETLGLATQTYVTIDENAFVKGSVYGGSENGYVQHHTQVNIKGNCQIGNGYVQMDNNGIYLDKLETPEIPMGVNRPYTAAEWAAGNLIPDATKEHDLYALVHDKYYNDHSLPECASWQYGQATGADKYAPWDKYYETTNYDSKGGRTTADDGHTFYGNVFGGGSGVIPYRPGKWHPEAGSVGGNTVVNITGGHILTNIYGGNELTDVYGKCTVNFGGTATLGVPRTLKQIAAHPVTCYLFGAGKGDQRVLFNKSTNVKDVEVNITGGTIYGSVFGGGEDGHVHRDVKMTIGTAATAAVGTEGEEGYQPAVAASGPTIGQWGTSYVDGNIFGGGRGFGADAYTAGNVAGSVKLEIKGGDILGSVYGGGRLGSVGYGLFESTNTANYGVMQDDNKDDEGNETTFYKDGAVGLGRGHIDITISGGTIGNNLEYIIPNATNMAEAGIPEADRDISKWNNTNNYWTQWKEYHKIPKTEFDTTTGHLTHTKGGNVFAGGMGNFYKQDGQTYINGVDWWKLGNAKSTTVTITGGTIKSNVYGGGELGQVVGHHTTKNSANQDINAGTEITIQGSNTTIGTEVKDASNNTQYTFGSVFGGGYGSLKEEITVKDGTSDVTSYPKYIAGRVKAGTKVNMTAGSVLASVYGGGEMAAVGESKTLGETLTTGFTGDTYVTISGGIIGKEKVGSTYFGGAKMGNVYGGGSGNNNTVRSGHVYGNTNVTISAGSVSGEPKIYHNVYGGGAYGSVGDFTYQTGTDAQTGTQKVIGIGNLNTDHTNSGDARVTITGGTIGYDGKENGMVFGSSRGDINEPGKRDDHTAWVYNANVIIGTAATPASGTPDTEGYVAATPASGPDIKGSVYGSGENGHTFNNTVVTVNGGIIGIDDENDDGFTVTSNGTTYEGAAYPYRGNVYGGGCGTDKYYEDHALETHDGNGQLFNSLAGIVYGTTTVNITGGTVVRNVYGAGAMGSVGKTTTTEGVTTITGGTTTINVSGGTIGVSGTVGDGNVFGAARGDADAKINEFALVKKETGVSVTGGTVKGNVYGGGELGCVGTFTVSDDMRTFTWQNTDGTTNTSANTNNKNTGVCNVTVNGSSAVINGHVFGAGKGKESTFWCEKAIAYSTNVNISNGTVNRNVYGGGEVGRVETDSQVKIGLAPEEEGGNSEPIINGSVFGGGAGVETHGYSALVRGNTTVIVDEDAHVAHSVYGGGEIASVGRYGLDAQKMPSILQGGGYCYVTVLGNAQIGDDVFGAGQGVTPHFDMTNTDPSKRSRRMTVYTNATDFPASKEYPNEGYTWGRYETGSQFVWDYLQSYSAYSTYLETLALATHPEVTIDGNATVNGSVFGGGELGLTKGSVIVNIQGGTIAEDVYGGGSLANSNTTSTVETTDPVTHQVTQATVYPTTTVNLKGGTINRNVYGGGLGRLAKDAVAEQPAVLYADVNEYNADKGTSLTADEFAALTDAEKTKTSAVEAQAAVTAVEAKVYGNVLVKLNEPTTSGQTTTYGDCEVKGTIFGCNNLNGSPQKGVTVHVYRTVTKTNGTVNDKPAKTNTTYEVNAVYGGGNLAAYKPDLKAVADTAKAYVIIDGCDLTSIKTVYGGGNAASVPATEVTVNGTYEIGQVFGGGNGYNDYELDGKWYDNPGANVGLKNYTHLGTGTGTESDPILAVNNDPEASTRESRETNYGYGIGKTHATIYGGTVHEVYGGSNSRGNVRVESRTTLEDRGCNFTVGEAYGGGRNAPQDGDAVLEIGCISGLEKAYGGAADADVNGNVVLTITNGTYGQVFGGNDAGGAIRGSITVNIEETGCNPIIIGELYGGGCNAAYSVYGYNDDGSVKETGSNPVADPVVNVKSFTSIGSIFGGGYGAPATMVGNPQVNINVTKGKYSDQTSDTYFTNKGFVLDAANKRYSKVVDATDNPHTVYVPAHEVGAIGAIYEVFGGGNAAAVIGTPHVNIGTKVGEVIPLVSKPIEDSEGRAPSGPDWTSYQLVTVEGVDIRGNVYGAGNNAPVTGDTEVVIGKNNDVKTYSFTSYSASTGGEAWSSGLAQTTGNYVTLDGAKLAEVEILTNGKYGEYVGKKFYVNPESSGRLQLYNADKEATSLWVSIEPFAYKTYSFKSYSASSGGTQYSTGTAAPTGNFKEFDGTEYMQIVVLTNGEASWIGKTFYVPINAETNGTARTQLYKASGATENVWVSISEP